MANDSSKQVLNGIEDIIKKTSQNMKLIASIAILAQAPFTMAQPVNVDPPRTESIGVNTEMAVTAPSSTAYGTRGLPQTSSAEALGEGRLMFGVQGAYYRQQKQFAGVPEKNANIFTGIGSVSLGINRHI